MFYSDTIEYNQEQLHKALGCIYGDSIKIPNIGNHNFKPGSLGYVKNLIAKSELVNQWINLWCKLESVRVKYEKRLIDSMQKQGKKIDYLIICEAPLLVTLNNQLAYNYIFDDGVVGAYRNVPYEIFANRDSERTDDYKRLGDPVIELFAKKGVAFLDLIPLPLPRISTKLREKWSYNNLFKHDGVPLPMLLMDQGITYLKSRGLQFDSNLKVVFMLPPTTALGILKSMESINELSVSNSEFLSQHLNNMLRRTSDDLQGVKYPQWFIYRQLAISKAGYPDKERFNKAIFD